MIRESNGLRYWLAVISSNRQHRVLPMSMLVGEATWYIPNGAGPAYTAAGAPEWVHAGGLVQSRNRALRDAIYHGVPCVQLSDDLKKLAWAVDAKNWRELDWDAFVEHMLGNLHESRYYLAGVAPVFNAFMADWENKYRHFIVGDCIAISNECRLTFDQRFKLKEDYDYTCQHIDTHGGVVRVAHLMADFDHRTNEGGAVDVRTPELEQEAITLLKEKWPLWIKDNPKRPNEVLLRVPKTDREVLT